MKDTDYWIIAVALLGFIAFLYFLDLIVFLMMPIYDYAPSDYYDAINAKTIKFSINSLVMLGLFGVSLFLFFCKNKYGFYLALVAGGIYLVQAVMAIMSLATMLNEIGIAIGAGFLVLAIALLFCIWKSKTVFEVGRSQPVIPVAGNAPARKKLRTGR